jgi:predicted nucleic acid-binding protein
MSRRVLVDTGPLIAIVSESDEFHEACAEQLHALPAPLVTCLPCLTEAAWLLRSTPHAFDHLLQGFDEGLFELGSVDAQGLPWIGQFMRRYRAIGAQLADACLCYLADGLKIDTIFTLDRRDFQVYRRKGGKPFKLLPSP